MVSELGSGIASVHRWRWANNQPQTEAWAESIGQRKTASAKQAEYLQVMVGNSRLREESPWLPPLLAEARKEKRKGTLRQSVGGVKNA
jgi:hypothetical protein